MPKGEQYEPTQPPASLIDTLYGGGDVVGILGFFANPLIAFGEESYHSFEDVSADEILGDIEKKFYEKEEKTRRFRMDDLQYGLGNLQYNDGLLGLSFKEEMLQAQYDKNLFDSKLANEQRLFMAAQKRKLNQEIKMMKREDKKHFE